MSASEITGKVQAQGTSLAVYDRACAAIAEAVSVDEVKNFIDISAAMRAYARQAKNHQIEADAVAIRLRATRRLDQMRQAQAATVGLATGGEHGGRRRLDGSRADPSNVRATLASQGIDKHLAHQGRVLGRLSDEAFERKVAEARSSVARVYRRAVREVEIEHEREERRAQTAHGGSVADLYALIASGYRAGTIAIDPPWPFEQYSERAAHAVFEHYETMSLDAIKALPIAQLAADDCALFLWVTWPFVPIWHEVIEAWGFTYSGLGFDWIKLTSDGERLHKGNGYNTRQNPEPCLIAKRGKPLRLDEGVHSVIMTRVGAHSEKPDEVYARMERLYGGPRLELFARAERPGWKTWGNQRPPPVSDEAPSSVDGSPEQERIGQVERAKPQVEADANAIIRELLEFIVQFTSKLSGDDHKFSQADRDAIVRELHQSANELTLLAQKVDEPAVMPPADDYPDLPASLRRAAP
jgi:N6-adenosine-specific RNA methylase IME4